MNCERIREQIPEVLAGRLEGAARERLIEHLDTCAACRAEVADLGVVWRGMEAMAQPEPSPAMKSRFLETLHAYEEGFQEAQRRQRSMEQNRLLPLLHLPVGRHLAAGDLRRVIGQADLALPLPGVVQVHVPPYLVHPRPERCLRLVGMAVLQNPEKDLLHQVLARRAIRCQMQKVPEQSPRVAVEKHLELPDAACPNLLHDLFVFHMPPFVI